MIRLVGLDLDGTLVDSAPDLADALGAALSALGFAPPSETQTRDWVGDGIEALIRRALEASAGRPPDDSLVSGALEHFDRVYDSRLFERSRVYPGVPETLDRLRASGKVLVCITNKRLVFAERLLDQAGLLARMHSVLGGDIESARKPAPDLLNSAAAAAGIDAADSAMVGDSANDYRAAQSAGFEFVWASYGYTATMRGLAQLPRHRIERFADLERLIETL